jgi:hypothetical protein
LGEAAVSVLIKDERDSQAREWEVNLIVPRLYDLNQPNPFGPWSIESGLLLAALEKHSAKVNGL